MSLQMKKVCGDSPFGPGSDMMCRPRFIWIPNPKPEDVLRGNFAFNEMKDFLPLYWP